jgi:hypothetical protein
MSRAPRPDREGSKCIVCSTVAEPVVSVTGVPALSNAFDDSRDGARAMPVGDIDLALCDGCGLLWNTSFDRSLAPYDSDYENSLHCSAAFDGWARELATWLVDHLGVRGRTVVEIGSGQGDFLGLLAENGIGRGVGVDPSLAEEHRTVAHGVELSFATGSLDALGERIEADLVVCRHVLEHVADPVALLAGARETVAHEHTSIYVEVPDAGYMLRTGSVWDLIYEHVSYFDETALVTVLARAGWHVRETGVGFGEQFLWAVADASPRAMTSVEGRRDGETTSDLVSRFGETRRAAIQHWDNLLRGRIAAGGRVAVWGAGSKGVSFLTAVPSARSVSAVIDVNPRKWGRYVPVLALPIDSPQDAARHVDTILVMNPMYLDEIRRRGAELGAVAEYHVVA